jgi:hypothetical protein
VLVVVDELTERVLRSQAAASGVDVGVLAGWVLSRVLIEDDVYA